MTHIALAATYQPAITITTQVLSLGVLLFLWLRGCNWPPFISPYSSPLHNPLCIPR